MKCCILVPALLLAVSGCRKHEEAEDLDTHRAVETSIAMMPEFQAVAAGARLADSVELFEGLPHPMFEREQYEHELATKSVFRIHDAAFYTQPLPIKPEDVEPLRSLCTSPDNFRAWSGYKMCGGFHGDYAVRWKHGDQAFDYVLCFGCGEAFLCMGEAAVRLDQRMSVFIPLLEPYSAQRPPHSPFPR